jgi:hypothetical protein
MSMTREQFLQVQRSARVYQQKYDDAFQPWNVRAPAPVLGEPIENYRRNLAVQAKKFLPEGHELRELQYRSMPDAAFEAFEPQLLKACQESAFRPDALADDEMRPVQKVNKDGLKITDWIGKHSFVKWMKPPVRYVLGFRTPQGFMNTSGRMVR